MNEDLGLVQRFHKKLTPSSVLADFELINIKVFLLRIKTILKEDYYQYGYSLNSFNFSSLPRIK